MLFDQPELINGALDVLTEYCTHLGKNVVDLGIDMIRVDVRAQQSMMISPPQRCEPAKPRFEYMINESRKTNKDIFITLHRCDDYSPSSVIWLKSASTCQV